MTAACANDGGVVPHGSGRIFTSFGPLIAGLLVVPFGSFNNAAACMTRVALLSIIAMLIGRERATMRCRSKLR